MAVVNLIIMNLIVIKDLEINFNKKYANAIV